MSIFLVLDILLVLLILLFTPIGFWRGPVKELFVTFGVLFGVLLADFWARPWGGDLRDITTLTAGSGSFIVAMAFLVASTFILGYGVGAALGPSYHSVPARILGAVIAAVNGMLLLSFSLQYVRLYLLSDVNEESLDDSFVSQFLLDQIGWILLGASVIAVPLLLFILVSGRRAYEVIYDDGYDDTWQMVQEHPAAVRYDHSRAPDARPRMSPPRIPAQARDDEGRAYKTEPEHRQRRAAAETRPLVIERPRVTAEPERNVGNDEPDWINDTDPHMVVLEPNQKPNEELPAEPEQQPAGDLAPGYDRCRTCHAVLAPGVNVCPNCGTLR